VAGGRKTSDVDKCEEVCAACNGGDVSVLNDKYSASEVGSVLHFVL
jgi:hypothetical protein